MKFRIIAVAALMACATLFTASARELTADERASLEETISGFIAAYDNRDAVAVASVLPDRIYAEIGARYGMSPEIAAFQIGSVVQETFAGLESFEMALDADTFVDFEESSTGVVYGYGPATFIASANGLTVRDDTEVLALLDDSGRWGLIQVGPGEFYEIVLAAYPSLEGLRLPAFERTESP